MLIPATVNLDDLLKSLPCDAQQSIRSYHDAHMAMVACVKEQDVEGLEGWLKKGYPKHPLKAVLQLEFKSFPPEVDLFLRDSVYSKAVQALDFDCAAHEHLRSVVVKFSIPKGLREFKKQYFAYTRDRREAVGYAKMLCQQKNKTHEWLQGLLYNPSDDLFDAVFEVYKANFLVKDIHNSPIDHLITPCYFKPLTWEVACNTTSWKKVFSHYFMPHAERCLHSFPYKLIHEYKHEDAIKDLLGNIKMYPYDYWKEGDAIGNEMMDFIAKEYAKHFQIEHPRLIDIDVHNHALKAASYETQVVYLKYGTKDPNALVEKEEMYQSRLQQAKEELQDSLMENSQHFAPEELAHHLKAMQVDASICPELAEYLKLYTVVTPNTSSPLRCKSKI